jgi:hypothetical protein
MPTPTDLVTDLPADFEVFGQAVDSSLADLKGGTTGQVLSKNSNTDMDFVWVTDAAGDITGVTAGTGISGGGTSGTVTVTNSMATAMTTKGDLVPATGSGAFARLGVGSNTQVLTADSTAATGMKWAAVSAPTNLGLVCVKAKTTFSAVASVTADSVFTSSYANYVIMFSYSSSAGATTDLQLRAGGTTATGANYTAQNIQANGTSVTGARVTNATTFVAGSANGADSSTAIITLFQPQVAAGTNIQSSYNYSGGNFATPVNVETKGSHSLATAYDGFIFTAGSGTITGSYTVFGYGVTA